MNLSGLPTERVRSWNRIPVESVVVVHDDMDLPFGQVRIKKGGGHGGHNGLRDLTRHIGGDFLRVRVGISRPPPTWDSADYVLSAWTDAEQQELPRVLDSACLAIETIVGDGPVVAMNRFNVRPRASSVEKGPNTDPVEGTQEPGRPNQSNSGGATRPPSAG
jgi:PTH1 family peptidyl-tRNA hydrolase